MRRSRTFSQVAAAALDILNMERTMFKKNGTLSISSVFNFKFQGFKTGQFIIFFAVSVAGLWEIVRKALCLSLFPASVCVSSIKKALFIFLSILY